MRPRDRQSNITDIVRIRGKMTVDELAAMFATSAETIRRDLSFLSSQGRLEKIHGGAILPRHNREGPFQQRMQQNGPAKRSIAQKARALVSPGDTLFIDTGSTTLIFAEELATIDDLTVITNSTAIAQVVKSGNSSAQVFLLGGAYNEDNQQTYGMMAIKQLDQFHSNLAILAVGAISLDAGAMNYSLDEAQLASAMLARAERFVLLVDSSKFNSVAPFSVAELEHIDTIVCESAPAGALANALQEANVEIVC